MHRDMPVIKFTNCGNYKNAICGCVCACACASECVSYSGHFCVDEQIYSMICTQNVHNALAESGQNRIKPSTSNVGIVLLSSQLKY